MLCMLPMGNLTTFPSPVGGWMAARFALHLLPLMLAPRNVSPIGKRCGCTKQASSSVRLCWLQEPHHSVTKFFTNVIDTLQFSFFLRPPVTCIFLRLAMLTLRKSEGLTKKVCKAMTSWALEIEGVPTSNRIGCMAPDRHSDYRDSCRAYGVTSMFPWGEYDDARWPRFQDSRPEKA